ncbi:MAG: class I SAM-dependent methyltransferase [Myxococcota bacterium]
MSAERWNLSPERLYIDTWTRWFLRENLPWPTIEHACNVGIGYGEFDDWLAFALPLGAPLVSLDRDPAIVAAFAERQRTDGHPRPSEAVHGDLFTSDRGPFGLVTATGSTLHETGDVARAIEALVRLVAPGGWLYVVVLHSLGGDEPLDAVPGIVRLRRFTELADAGLTAVLAQPR